MEQYSPPKPERRRATRTRCNHPGRILTDVEVFCECTVVDVTKYGARLKLPRDAVIPDRFYVMTSDFILEARLRWRRNLDAGVEIVCNG